MNDLLILSILLPGPKHGYRLKREAGLMLGQENLHPNLVYPLLRRFMSEGLVEQKTAPGERGQTRKLYSLTPLGHRVLIEKINAFNEQDARSPQAFQLRVGFFRLLSPEARERILAAREAALQQQDQRMAALQQGMELGEYGEEIVRHRREHIKAELDWVQRLRQFPEKQKGQIK
jgi:DNA-binding PadR family transcriptional regulator